MLVETISDEDNPFLAKSTGVDFSVRPLASRDDGTTPVEPIDQTGLTWCEFCKGHYNEYHFGDIDEDVHV